MKQCKLNTSPNLLFEILCSSEGWVVDNLKREGSRLVPYGDHSHLDVNLRFLSDLSSLPYV